jgi:uncharacterized protein (TIGR01244 family)
MTRILTPTFSVSAQLSPADLPAMAAQGFKTVINNRPDGEGGAAQPLSADLQRAAQAAGLHYVYLPVVSGALTPANVGDMREALASAPAPVLAFCRSGARSAQLHSLALGLAA